MLRWSVIFPVLLSIAALVISFLLLFAGSRPGFLEDYSLVRLNLTTLGYDVISDNIDNIAGDNEGISGIIDNISDLIGDGLDDIGNSVADRLADELGISEWYSIHILTVCQGEYDPNATDSDPSYKVSECTTASPDARVNLTDLINNELQIGPLRITLDDINWPSEIDERIDQVNDALLALFIVYVVAIGFCGFALIGAVAAFFFDPRRRRVSLANMLLAALAALLLLGGSIATMIGGRRGADEINNIGEDVGISAEAGTPFIILSWVAFALMALAVVYWGAVACFARRDRGGLRSSKPWN